MKNLTNKSKIATIALILVLTISVIFVALPIVSAHDPPWTVPTWCYVSVTNSIIGVNQQVVIVYWVNAIPPTAQGAYGDRWTFTVDVTKPDGSKENLGPSKSDPVGGGWTTYTPDQIGTYTIVAHMDEHTVTGLPDLTPSVISNPASVNDTYLASSSDPVTFIVQEEPIQPWTEAPLPTLFWTRPINAANRDWDVLAGNWLSGAAQNVNSTLRFSYGTGPESAHVMWATPMWAGGIMDERFGNIGYQTGHYEGTDFIPPIILNGKIYYNVMSLPREGWRVLDLYTGEELWFHNTTGPVTGVSASSSGSIRGESLAFGQILDIENPNQHGGMPYLWSTNGPDGTWMMFDAETGNYMCSIANVSARGTSVYGKDGSILYYNIVGSGANKRLTCWNTTQAIWWKGTQQQYQAGDYSEFPSNSYWMWRPGLNVTYDGSHGYSLNVSIPDVSGSILAVREGQFVIGGTQGSNDQSGMVPGNMWALSLKTGEEGTLLWNYTYTSPYTDVDFTGITDRRQLMILGGGRYGVSVDPEDGIFLYTLGLTRQFWGFNLTTGEQIWGPTTSAPAMDVYRVFTYIYEGKLLSCGFGGVLIAYNITTGEQLWNYTARQVGFESPYGNFPINVAAIADGKIYAISGEHSITQPMWRGSYLRCINATTGEEIWKILQFGADGGGSLNGVYVYMADGYVVGLNQYDSQIYCYGKGPSATTVTASSKVSVHGSSVLIEGTVTDQCVGAKKIAEKVGFTNGVSAVSDESMQAWMEYLYEQQGMPTNATGVEVVLETLDPNGNFYEIGRATSSVSGVFGTAFIPQVPGLYKIIATFEGSSSYYGSYAETYINVEEAPSPAQPLEPESTTPEPTEPTPTEPESTTPEPTEPEPAAPEPTEPEATAPAETSFITTELAIIAAVAVACAIGVVSFWALRKRK